MPLIVDGFPSLSSKDRKDCHETMSIRELPYHRDPVLSPTEFWESNLPAVLEILDGDIAKLPESDRRWHGWGERRPRNTLLPTGYEDFLRALGYWLDGEGASWVTISELVSIIAVHGWTGREGYRGVQVVPFELFLTSEDIETHLNEAFGRRKPRKRLWPK